MSGVLSSWVLVLVVSLPGHAPEQRAVAVTLGQAECSVAGQGMKLVLEAATPGLVVGWACIAQGELS